MNEVACLLCVVISVTGSVYCLMLLVDCRRRFRSLKGAARSSPGTAHLKLVGMECDCLSQLLLASVFLGVALFLLVGFSFHVGSSLLRDDSLDRQIRSSRETVVLPGCPPVFFWHSASEGRPVYAIECAGKPVSDDQLRRLLREAPELYVLNLASTEITDDSLREIGRMRGLCGLNLAGTRVSDAGLQHLVSLKNLEYLGLRDTGITDAGLRYLADLRSLKNLDLRGTAVTDAGLAGLGRLHKLESLDLDNTRVTPESITRLKSALPGVTIRVSSEIGNWGFLTPA